MYCLKRRLQFFTFFNDVIQIKSQNSCENMSIEVYKSPQETCQSSSHRHFTMNIYTLGTIFFSLALIMGQLPGNSARRVPNPMLDQEDDDSNHQYDYDPEVDNPIEIIVNRSQSQHGEGGSVVPFDLQNLNDLCSKVIHSMCNPESTHSSFLCLFRKRSVCLSLPLLG